VAAVACLGP